MGVRVIYPTGDDFKWRERSGLAKKIGVDLVREEKIDLGKRMEMMTTIDESVTLKWKLAAKRYRGEWVIVDMNDLLLFDRVSWYAERRISNLSQKDFLSKMWTPGDGKTAELTKVGLKNVLLLGKGDGLPLTFQSILDGIIMYRPLQKSFERFPAIVPYVYVTQWQEMLDRVYLTEVEIRPSSWMTHDAITFSQAIESAALR